MKYLARKVALLSPLVIVGLALSGCSNSPNAGNTNNANAVGPITFAATQESASWTAIAAAWNSAHPDQKVTLTKYSSSNSNDTHATLVQAFQAKSDQWDLVLSNNIWTSEFAARKWIVPLDPSAYPLDKLLPAPVETGKYQGQLYAVPFFTDGGLLYYRSDIYPTPPKTFAEMATMCKAATAAPASCYAGQYAQYDGLTVNFSEAVEAAGGHVLDAQGNPTVTSPEAHQGLQLLVDWFKDGLIPKEAITYQEEPSRMAFQKGQLSFLRNWPYVYSLATKSGADSVIAGKFGVAPLPGIKGPGKSALGGWDLAVSTYSKHQGTAKAFAAFAVSEASQRMLVEKDSYAPVMTSLYTDQSLISANPYLPVLKQTMDNAVPLPKTTNWSGVSLAIQKNAYQALQGQLTVDAALTQMQSDIQQAIQSQ